jgi:hypothetical protein
MPPVPDGTISPRVVLLSAFASSLLPSPESGEYTDEHGRPSSRLMQQSRKSPPQDHHLELTHQPLGLLEQHTSAMGVGLTSRGHL